ncbi:manganese efflux pump MntP family protein [Brevundimonas sp.]|uniref:manganese efflux pump MntP n=1 Tax=Brevundimonas sp. TaxID=1871086 RepID=UPI00198FC105|nr:manganese efflux pump MntP family protein [Brevundimonas sp.]MBD3835765.1 manganese efflux pump [Brevundimonas sp.]
MTPGAIAVLSLSMSTDAFAAAVGRGASHRPALGQAMRAGLVFGVIEAITPIIGWSLGLIAAGLIQQIDHWIAFALLAVVGAHMIKEGLSKPDAAGEGAPSRRSGLLALVATAVGTSIDAAAVGVGLAFIGANIWVIAASIGFTTFVLTTTGMLIGKAVGVRFGKTAELLGGVALIGIGLLILAEHLGWIGGLAS